jgi:hypothetical protein
MRRRAAATAFAWGILLLLCGCATKPNSPHRNLTQVWQEYLDIPDQRALAIAGDPRRSRWVSAASGGHSTSSAAQEDALRECRVRRKIRRLQPACVLYAVGKQIVWQSR